ncbi:MAG: PEP-CTERM sorting domain-containing protein [Cyanobacteria bacterium P01_C01_bin.89]
MFSNPIPKATKSSLVTSVATVVGAGVLSAGSAGALTINFDEGLAGTPGDKTRITNQYEKDYGVTFSSKNNRNVDYGLVLYDTECISRRKGGKDSISLNGFQNNVCSGKDEDLATGRGKYGNYDYDTPLQGNVLILQENKDYGDPDDDAKGGQVTLNFNTDVNSQNLSFINGITLEKFGFVDLDEAMLRNKKLSFVFEYVDPDRSSFVIDKNNYDNFIEEVILSTDWDGDELDGDNSLREYTFNNDNGDFDAIKNITVEYHQVSGAIAYVEYDGTPPVEVPEPGMLMGLGAFALGAFKLRRRKDDDLNSGE